jgi:hypothetical protein
LLFGGKNERTISSAHDSIGVDAMIAPAAFQAGKIANCRSAPTSSSALFCRSIFPI